MILKILTRTKTQSFRQLIEYITDKEKWNLINKENKGFIVTHNLRGNTIQEWVSQYKANELNRKMKRSHNVYLTHEILSWHKDDQKYLTSEKLEIMTREYLRLRNPKGIYVAIPHFDKDHYHVHICASGIEYKTGKSLRLGKSDLAKLKTGIQGYQIEKYPELNASVVKHGINGNKAITDGEYRLKQRSGRKTDNESVLEILNNCFQQAVSREDFFKRMKECGLSTYMRGDKLTGVLHKNRKHRLGRLGFTEEKLEKLNKTLIREKQMNVIRRNKAGKNFGRTR